MRPTQEEDAKFVLVRGVGWGGCADCRQDYQSSIQLIEKTNEATREILVSRCGHIVIGTPKMTSVSGKRCYGKF